MRIRKIDFMELLFLLLVLTGEHFFYLVNLPITEMDLAVIIAVVMFFLCIYCTIKALDYQIQISQQKYF